MTSTSVRDQQHLATRLPLDARPNTTASPHTPQRTAVASFASPGGFRAEEELLVFEIGSRYLRAGLAGEYAPRCALKFTPSASRRVGDYREWLSGYKPPSPSRKSTRHWTKQFELWQLDIREDEAGLVEDKLERAMRDAYSRYLLLDSKAKKVAVVLPAILPVTYIESTLNVLFRNFQSPSVTLLPSPVLSVTAAGMRSGLVVDIGWHETVVTAVYELRQVQQKQSTRAMRLATLHFARMLMRHEKDTFHGDLEEPALSDAGDEFINLQMTTAEEALSRLAWCQSRANLLESRSERPGPGGRQISGSWPADPSTEASSQPETASLPTPRKPEDLPFASFCFPIESSLLANSKDLSALDDNELSLHHLIHQFLVALPADVRGTCISRIMFTGGGSLIPGLKSRLMEEVGTLIASHEFDPVRGTAAEQYRKHLAEVSANRRRNAQDAALKTKYPANSAGLPAGETPPPIPAGLVMPEMHPIDDKVSKSSAEHVHPGVHGILRAIETLGPWAGASMAANLRVKGVVEVERDNFLANGIWGANKVTASSGPKSKTGFNNAAGGKEQGWTLGIWA